RYKKTGALIDFGLKYNPQLINKINDFDFILITHAHPDHYIWTLEDEDRINIPVYLTRIVLDYGKYKPKDYRIFQTGKKYSLKCLDITAYKVIHSIRCPAVGYKIKGDKTIIYAPDIVDFEEDKGTVLKDVDLLIADGSSLNINMVRRKEARGYYGSKSRSYKIAKEQLLKSMSYAYRDRKNNKRNFRRLWITRINAAARINGISYNEFISGLKKASVDINRKILSEIAVSDPDAFQKLTEIAKK
ncbi:unnamed protein product, partial [marine sediment metagenome]